MFHHQLCPLLAIRVKMLATTMTRMITRGPAIAVKVEKENVIIVVETGEEEMVVVQTEEINLTDRIEDVTIIEIEMMTGTTEGGEKTMISIRGIDVEIEAIGDLGTEMIIRRISRIDCVTWLAMVSTKIMAEIDLAVIFQAMIFKDKDFPGIAIKMKKYRACMLLVFHHCWAGMDRGVMVSFS
jgi:hypothetical protein